VDSLKDESEQYADEVNQYLMLSFTITIELKKEWIV
jgi:hypothetical protein